MEDMVEAGTSKRPLSDETTNPKRSRGLGVVTPNACTECRKKRAKCDGQTPCGRCKTQKDAECVYEVPVRQSKENMRAEIEQLRRYKQQTESILGGLTSTDRADTILEQIRKGETLDTISDSIHKSRQSESPMEASGTTYLHFSDRQAIRQALKPSQNAITNPLMTLNLNDPSSISHQAQYTQPTLSLIQQGQGSRSGNSWHSGGDSSNAGASSASQHEDIMSWESDSAPNNPQLSSRNTPLMGASYQTSEQDSPNSNVQQARGYGQETILGGQFETELSNSTFVYAGSWTTVTSDTALVEHLMTLYFCWEYPTFASLSKEHFLEDFRHGKQKNCSSLLVNSILALGCRFSTHPKARADPKDKNTAGDHFFAEAQRLLSENKERHYMTTIQALGLMAIRESSCGRSSESIFLSGQSIRLAIEMGLHLEHVQDKNGECSEDETAVRAATFWGAFSLDQAWSLSIGRLPCFSQDIHLVSKPGIIDHVERSSWVPYTDNGTPGERNFTQPSNVRSVYKTFCELSEIVHKHLYAFYVPGNTLKSKTLLDIYTQYLNWYDAIPSALRLGQNFTPAVLFVHMYYHYAILLLFRPFIKLQLLGSSVSPRDVCNQAGDAISALVKSYSQLYTLQRTPSFVPYFVLISSITHLVTLGNTGASSEKLRQAVVDLKDMTACHGFADMALDIVRFLIYYWKVNTKLDDLIDVDKTDPKLLCLTKSTSTNEFCPNMEGFDMMKEIAIPVSDGENPLFWPFPLQGRPMLGLGSLLAQAGFSVLSPVP